MLNVSLQCLKTGIRFAPKCAVNRSTYVSDSIQILSPGKSIPGDLQIDIKTGDLYITGIPHRGGAPLWDDSEPDLIISIVGALSLEPNRYLYRHLYVHEIRAISGDLVRFIKDYNHPDLTRWLDQVPIQGAPVR